ncbi:MAG: flippase [bacterium]
MRAIATTVAKNTLTLMVGQVIALSLNLVTIVVLARYWGETFFGIFSYSLVIVGLFGLIADFGMKPIIVREVSRHRERASRILSNALSLKIALSVFSIALMNLISIIVFSDNRIRQAVFILSFTVLFSSKVSTLRIVFESIFHADMEMKYPVFFQFVDGLLQLVFVLLLISLRAPPSTILWMYVLANVPGFIFILRLALKRVALRPIVERETAKWLLKESFPLFLYIGFVMVFERMDVLFLKAFWDEATVGVYSSAFRLTAPLVFIPFAVTSAMYPLMSRVVDGNENRQVILFSMGLKILFLIGITLGVLGTLFGQGIFRLLYGPLYAQAEEPFQFLLWSQGIAFLTFFLIDFNNSQKRQKYNTYYIISALVLAVPIQWLLISRMSVLGASLAKLVLNVIGFAILVKMSVPFLSKEQQSCLKKVTSRFVCLLLIVLMYFSFPTIYGLRFLLMGIPFILIVSFLFTRKEWELFKVIKLNLSAKPRR